MKWWKSRKGIFRMGRLAPEGTGSAGTGMSSKEFTRHPCDSCGFSDNDGGAITDATYEIVTSKGSIFLCTHHFNKNRLHALEHGYKVLLLKVPAW